MRLSTAIADGLASAFAKSRMTQAWYDALCLLVESVGDRKAEGDAEKLESAFFGNGGGFPCPT